MLHSTIFSLIPYEVGNIIVELKYDVDAAVKKYINEDLIKKVKEIYYDGLKLIPDDPDIEIFKTYLNRFKFYIKKQDIKDIDTLLKHIDLFVKNYASYTTTVSVKKNEYGNMVEPNTQLVFDSKTFGSCVIGRQVGDKVVPLDDLHKNLCKMNGWIIKV